MNPRIDVCDCISELRLLLLLWDSNPTRSKCARSHSNIGSVSCEMVMLKVKDTLTDAWRIAGFVLSTLTEHVHGKIK